MFQDFIKGLRENVSLIICILNPEQEVEIICLLFVLIVAFGDNAHDFAELWYIFNQGDLAAQVHHTPNRYRFQKEHLINSK